MPHIQTDNQPVTQITVIEPEPDKQAEALSLMTERARFMARQPGFISVSLHRSLDGRRIVNYILCVPKTLNPDVMVMKSAKDCV
jgi:quinol monooxygenase YgiN